MIALKSIQFEVADLGLQRSTAQVLSAIYEQDFIPCSFGGRPGVGAHHARATLTEMISGDKVCWVLEAGLKSQALSNGQLHRQV